jgi:hypothetical protein
VVLLVLLLRDALLAMFNPLWLLLLLLLLVLVLVVVVLGGRGRGGWRGLRRALQVQWVASAAASLVVV